MAINLIVGDSVKLNKEKFRNWPSFFKCVKYFDMSHIYVVTKIIEKGYYSFSDDKFLPYIYLDNQPFCFKKEELDKYSKYMEWLKWSLKREIW